MADIYIEASLKSQLFSNGHIYVSRIDSRNVDRMYYYSFDEDPIKLMIVSVLGILVYLCITLLVVSLSIASDNNRISSRDSSDDTCL